MKKLRLLTLLAVATMVAGCSEKAKAPETVATPIPVAIVKVARVEVPRLCEAPGTVVPKDRAVVSARVIGTVASADFAIGQKVATGQLLVTLSAPEMEARVAQAQAALDKAKRDFERESALLEGGATTRETVHDMAERLRSAEASLAEAVALASYTKISAPFAGRITRKMANVGDFAAPGTALFEIDGLGALRVEASLPESFPEVEPGTEVMVISDGVTEKSTLAESSPAADVRSRTRLVKTDLEASSTLRPGQFVRLMWPVGTMPEILIPKSAVSRVGQMERVFTLEGAKAKMRLVRTGEFHGELVQILSGLAEGDKVVVDPPSGLENDSAVEVK
jgi:RND family efflux transporter MFP subunit